jgi:hypothetical protein
MGSVLCAYRKAVADVSALRRFFRACDWVRGKPTWTLTHLAKLPLGWAVDVLRTTRALAHVRARAHSLDRRKISLTAGSLPEPIAVQPPNQREVRRHG